MGITLCSCVRVTPGVPDMPYNAARYANRDVQPAPAPVAAPTTAPATPAATPATQKPTTPAPAPAVQKPVKPAPAPVADTKKPLDLTKPIAPKETAPVKVTEPAPSPAPVTVTEPKPAPTSKGITTSDSGVTPPPAITPEAPKKITNKDGHIPTAMRVEGDPTRVYNPLDPSKTIRVIDKNGNPYPSGKELKVRGTDYHFYVP